MITWRIYDNSKVTSTHFWDAHFKSNTYFWETTTENMWEIMHSWSLYCRIHVTGITHPPQTSMHTCSIFSESPGCYTYFTVQAPATYAHRAFLKSFLMPKAFICCNIFEHMYYQQYQYKYKDGEFHQFSTKQHIYFCTTNLQHYIACQCEGSSFKSFRCPESRIA